ncbi:MAG: hypothetical protein CML13_16075 [Puniceicoccaceae bacterium]|nr:hypothetical protein [Puniceicoccaceae bacterium]|tara:strand:+ start:66 stop:275 length:210 start_codon:yes stop_codon:yes gene_type:complete
MSNDILTAMELPWSEIIDASLFAFGVTFGAIYSKWTHQGTIDYERKRCDKFEGRAAQLQEEIIEILNNK